MSLVLDCGFMCRDASGKLVPIPDRVAPGAPRNKPGPIGATLIDCPDCGHKVSPRAASCPNCGGPVG